MLSFVVDRHKHLLSTFFRTWNIKPLETEETDAADDDDDTLGTRKHSAKHFEQPENCPKPIYKQNQQLRERQNFDIT